LPRLVKVGFAEVEEVDHELIGSVTQTNVSAIKAPNRGMEIFWRP